jgi:hypothetical protein
VREWSAAYKGFDYLFRKFQNVPVLLVLQDVKAQAARIPFSTKGIALRAFRKRSRWPGFTRTFTHSASIVAPHCVHDLDPPGDAAGLKPGPSSALALPAKK